MLKSEECVKCGILSIFPGCYMHVLLSDYVVSWVCAHFVFAKVDWDLKCKLPTATDGHTFNNKLLFLLLYIPSWSFFLKPSKIVFATSVHFRDPACDKKGLRSFYMSADGQRFNFITRFPALTWLWKSMTNAPVCVSSPPQNGNFPCDADIDRLTLNESYINGAHHVSVLKLAIKLAVAQKGLILSMPQRWITWFYFAPVCSSRWSLGKWWRSLTQ